MRLSAAVVALMITAVGCIAPDHEDREISGLSRPHEERWLAPIGNLDPDAADALIKQPVSRSGFSVASDASTGTTYLFGGTANGIPVGDLWAWDGTQWRPIPGAVSPSPRAGAALAFDAVRHVLVLFGGAQRSGYACDTWSWSPQSSTWSQNVTSGHVPSCRADGIAVFDLPLGGVVMFGGTNGGGQLTDAWLWDGTMWSEV